MTLVRMGFIALLLFTGPAFAAAPTSESQLQGTWTLIAATRILPAGEEVNDYGEHPKGRLHVDAKGRYSLQIFKSERRPFSAKDKADGTSEEFKAAVLGSSTHYGTLAVDARAGILTFSIEAASFPNWEGTVQKREYTLKDGLLIYKVPPRPDGSIPVSKWQRQE